MPSELRIQSAQLIAPNASASQRCRPRVVKPRYALGTLLVGAGIVASLSSACSGAGMEIEPLHSIQTNSIDVSGAALAPGELFIVTTLRLTNTTNQSLAIAPIAFTVTDTQGRKFLGGSYTDALPDGCKDGTALAPSGSTQCTVMFSAPADATTVSIAYKNPAYSGGDTDEVPLQTQPCALCGGTCVDFSSDPHNCGGCGNEVGSGGVCNNGVPKCGANPLPQGDACVDGEVVPDPSPWGCLGTFTPPDTMGNDVEYAFTFVDALSNAPVNDIAVKLCAGDDAACSSPLKTGLLPDASGQISVSVPAGFDGYLDIKDGAGGTSELAWMPALVYLGPIVTLPPKPATIRLLSFYGALGLSSSVGETMDPSHGHAIVFTADCQDNRSAGVSLSSISCDNSDNYPDIPFYFKNSNLGDGMSTDTEGAVMLFNLPAGITTVSTDFLTTGQAIGTSAFRVRAGAVTYAKIAP
jgi:Domain of unknown function (DUF4352)